MPHLHMNSTFGETPQHRCLTCGQLVILVCTFEQWKVPNADEIGDDEIAADGTVQVNEDVSGHYCRKCRKLTALFMNRS